MNATENKTTFKHLARMVEIDDAQRRKNTAHYIEHGFLESWAEEHRTPSDNGLRQYSTPRRWEQYQNGEITRDQAVKYATARAEKDHDKQTIKKQDKLLRALDSVDVQTVSISVDWKRSAMWGYNPTATVVINGRFEYVGTASGCGYDKRTAAVGDALNQCPAILKMLYTAKEKALKKAPASIRKNPDASNADLIHYGAGYGVLPYFEGGVGISSFKGVFEACGLVCTMSHATKTTEFYYFEKGAK